jgi:hypothetical protein
VSQYGARRGGAAQGVIEVSLLLPDLRDALWFIMQCSETRVGNCQINAYNQISSRRPELSGL